MTSPECLLLAAEASRAAEAAKDAVTRAMYLHIAEAWIDLSQFVETHDEATFAMLDLIQMMTRRLPRKDTE